MENTELQSSDVSPETSSESQPSSTPSESPAQASAPELKKESENVPFHEHPRFQELVKQKNQFAESYKQLESKYAEMEAKLKSLSEGPKPKSPQEQLAERLKGIDPEFGSEFENLLATRKELEELKQWKQQSEMQRVREYAVNTVMQLHTENKVPEELRTVYNSQLEAMYAQNPQAFVRDPKGAYKQVHEMMSKVLESVKRQERESYISSKKADASVPTSQPKGKAVNPAKGNEFSKDPAEARSQLIKRALNLAKSSNNI